MGKDIGSIGNINEVASVLWCGRPEMWGSSDISLEDMSKWLKGAIGTL